MIAKNTRDKSSKTEKILVSFWFLILLSINSSANDLLLINNIKNLFIDTYNFFDFLNNFYLFKNSIFIVLNFFRTVSVFAIFFIAIIWILNLKKKKNFFLIFFFLFSLWQIAALNIYQIENISIDTLENYRLIVSNLSTIFIFYLALYYNNKKIYKKFIYCLIFFISLIILFFSLGLINEFLNSDILSLYGTVTLSPESQTFLQPTPRITGIARMLVIIFYFLFFFNKYLKNNNIKFFFYILLFFIIFLVYGMQTRGGIIGILIFGFYYIFFFNEKKIAKLKTICLLIILPVIFWHTLISLKKNFFIQINHNESKTLNKFYETTKDIRIIKDDTSGRIEIWKKSLKIIKEKKIIWGIGPKADRRLLTNTSIEKYNLLNPKSHIIYDNNSSNALIYSYLSGGIISTFFLILVYYLSVKQIVSGLFQKMITKQEFLKNFARISLIFLILRSVFENSFAIFGLDFCIFILCYFVLLKENLIQKNRGFI
jgi:O-antigen ligase